MVGKRGWFSRFGLPGIMLVIAFVCLFPLWYTFIISVSDKTAVESGFVKLLPVGFTLSSYMKILSDGQFFNSFLISVKRVVLGGGLNYILTVTMAYPISKTKGEFKDKNFYVWFLIFIMLFPPSMIPMYLTIKNYGLMNSIWALVLPSAVPVFNIIILSNFYRGIPKELEEAALMDGANIWHILFRIFVPLSLPALVTVTLYSIVFHWNEFFGGLIYMTDTSKYPLQTYIQQLSVTTNFRDLTPKQISELAKISTRTLDAAKIVVAMVPILLIYPFLQRYFITGMTLGAVKE